MTVTPDLLSSAGHACEICQSTTELQTYHVVPEAMAVGRSQIVSCSQCANQMNGEDDGLDANHWRVLNEAIWSVVPAVKVVCWRMIQRLKNEPWIQDLEGMLFLEDQEQIWAKGGIELGDQEIVHLDSNGQKLESGDTVILIKDLKVKGANFIAKRGTAVRRISLVHDNAEQIEGRVEGQHIVILTQYVKKSKV